MIFVDDNDDSDDDDDDDDDDGDEKMTVSVVNRIEYHQG